MTCQDESSHVILLFVLRIVVSFAVSFFMALELHSLMLSKAVLWQRWSGEATFNSCYVSNYSCTF